MSNKQHCSDGPVKTLPGSKHLLFDADIKCDNHESRIAIVRLQGETDSFGCEYHYLCESCLDEYDKESKDVEEVCDWCKKTSSTCAPHRDFEEGSAGPVYNVCSK